MIETAKEYKERAAKEFPVLNEYVKVVSIPELVEEVAVQYFIAGTHFKDDELRYTTVECLTKLRDEGIYGLK